jgi:hypothetical protein
MAGAVSAARGAAACGRQIPGEHYEPRGRQLDGLLADQDRANDFRREAFGSLIGGFDGLANAFGGGGGNMFGFKFG